MTDDEPLESLFWQARVARGVLNAANTDPSERAAATRQWVLLYREVHSPRDETTEERARRLDFLECLAAKAGIAPLSFYLREFALDFSHSILASLDPTHKIESILKGPQDMGRPKLSFRESIKIVAAVEKLHDSGVTFAKAYESVASTLGKSRNITSNAVRNIRERAMKDRVTASLVRLVVAGIVEL